MSNGDKTGSPAEEETAIARSRATAQKRKDTNEPVEDICKSCPVKLVLIIQRLEEWPKNPKATDKNAKQGGTIGEFELKIIGDKSPLVTGYTLEAAGPSSKKSNSDQRVVAGEYSLIKNPGSKGPYRLAQTSKNDADNTFGERNAVNIHPGNHPRDLEGCICPGPGRQELGVKKIKGVEDRANAYPAVTSPSTDKLKEIESAIKKYGIREIRDTYDGAKSAYTKSSYYCNVKVIIREIRLNYVYFALYYVVADKAFERAASTWKRQVEASSDFRKDKDVFLMIPVSTETEFKAAWQKALETSKLPYHAVKEGRVFSHASKDEGQDGLEFKGDAANDGTTDALELSALPVLNWSEGAALHLHACNSGVVGTRQWAPAGKLATAQNVKVIGQAGFAYFSSSPHTYVKINQQTQNVYLLAFRRRRNVPILYIGDGGAIQEVSFPPGK